MAASTSSSLSFSNSLLGSSFSSSIATRSPFTSARPSGSVKQLPCIVYSGSQKAFEEQEVAISRRSVVFLSLVAAATAAPMWPAHSAHVGAANSFGTPQKDTGFTSVNGDTFSLRVPSKWNSSKEQELSGTVLRFEDNFDVNNHLSLQVLPAEKRSIKDYGPPEKFIKTFSFLLGKQSYSGKTQSEGRFDPNDVVATLKILESSTPNIDGKDYYNISVLTRTADGDEHLIIVASVSGGKLYFLKVQAGDKRRSKSAKKFMEGASSSFSVA